ncbi:hypothetical protein NHP190003_12280 [Helicobacter sp. NHP19-003]|uniref:Uncharacterized protein n=1 Tax=Helicobacter gastrocanis TaxID=2849641 RepID=A0ABM7SBC8_9HELI|nr:hypothetical protein [Helicobacter sp. NHP19-003]BCZ17946.1 hypothetical protein NHP190003_12280 [Helicobacter sp. NHP19-003]
MVILYATEQYHPLQTGTATADYGLSQALAQAGHRVYVITSDVFNHAEVAMSLKRWGDKHTISSGNTIKQALELAPNLYVVEFHIYNEKWVWLGELENYIDFVKNFDCDVLINSSIATWNSDAIYPHLSTCKAKRKFLRNHVNINDIPPPPQTPSFWESFCTKFKRQQEPHPLVCLATQLKSYDKIFLLHANSPLYHYLNSQNDLNVEVLPNGVFAKDICPPKFLPPPLQHT